MRPAQRLVPGWPPVATQFNGVHTIFNTQNFPRERASDDRTLLRTTCKRRVRLVDYRVCCNTRPDAPIAAAPQRHVGSRELPEHQNHDLTCQVHATGRATTSGPPQCQPSTLRHHTSLAIGLTSIVSDHLFFLASGHKTATARSLETETGHAGWPEASVRSLPVTSFRLRFSTNVVALDQICQPPSVSPCACVLAYFHKYYQGC
jgi:hypothetical protein